MRDHPTDAELDRVRTWPPDGDPMGWLDYVRSLWRWQDWGWHRTQRRLYLSTGGWSGNEEIIGAMQGCWYWRVSFISHRVGGHYALDLTRLRQYVGWELT